MDNLSLLLKRELAELSLKNPNFSMRAFARKLDVSPSYLSRILNGRKVPAYNTAARLLREIGLNKAESNEIIKKSGLERTPTLSLGKNLNRERRSERIVSAESFRLVADWYHFPIMELIRTKKFRHDAEFIAIRLNLQLPVVEAALERLEMLGLIRNEESKIELTNVEFINTSNDMGSVAIRKHHQQMLRKSSEALVEQTVETREFQALNLNFNPSDLTAAKKDIRSFFKKFNKKYSRSCGEEVYQANFQFFSLTQEIE